MKEMLGYQVDELAAALRMPLSFLSFDPTTLIVIYKLYTHIHNLYSRLYNLMLTWTR